MAEKSSTTSNIKKEYKSCRSVGHWDWKLLPNVTGERNKQVINYFIN